MISDLHTDRVSCSPSDDGSDTTCMSPRPVVRASDRNQRLSLPAISTQSCGSTVGRSFGTERIVGARLSRHADVAGGGGASSHGVPASWVRLSPHPKKLASCLEVTAA